MTITEEVLEGLNIDAIRLWVKALREPNRKQCRGQLADEFGGQCCLDVAIEIYNKNKDNSCRTILPHERINVEESLPEEVQKWFGFYDPDPTLYSESYETCGASTMNDSKAASFAEIADAVENTFLKGNV